MFARATNLKSDSNAKRAFALTTFASCLAAGALTSSAAASILSHTGDAVQVVAPPSAFWGAFGATQLGAYIFDEQQSVNVAGLAVDLLGDGTNGIDPGGTLNGAVDSHFVHVDIWTMPNSGFASGTITFSGQILGLAYDAPSLDASDAVTGLATTIYGTGDWARVTHLPYLPGGATVSGNTLTFGLYTGFGEYTDLRVFTQPAPAPGAGAMLLAAIGAGVIGGRRRSG